MKNPLSSKRPTVWELVNMWWWIYRYSTNEWDTVHFVGKDDEPAKKCNIFTFCSNFINHNSYMHKMRLNGIKSKNRVHKRMKDQLREGEEENPERGPTISKEGRNNGIKLERRIWAKKAESRQWRRKKKNTQITNIVFHIETRFMLLLDSMANLHALTIAYTSNCTHPQCNWNVCEKSKKSKTMTMPKLFAFILMIVFRPGLFNSSGNVVVCVWVPIFV